MKVKASLHLHASEDEVDGCMISYSFYELIDRLAELGFKVAASTCHYHSTCHKEHIDYAAEKGIMLIPGVEAKVDGFRHVLILNGGDDADNVTTFEQLKRFKADHPEALVIAAHPNQKLKSSLTLSQLEEYRELFDAAEHSWFYSKGYNSNKQVAMLCAEMHLPHIATADAHILDYLDADYAVLEMSDLTTQEVFDSIRQGRFENHSQAKSFWQVVSFFPRIYLQWFLISLFGR